MELLRKIYLFSTGHWYALYVSGHGSSFKRERGLLTKKEALRQADHWVGIADTIGGRAQVENTITKRLIYT